MTRTILAATTAILLSSVPGLAGGWAVELPNFTFPKPGIEAPQPATETTVSTRRASD